MVDKGPLEQARGLFRSLWHKDASAGPQGITGQRFVVVDTETTGLEPIRDRILSLGILPLQNGRIRVGEGQEWFLSQEVFDHRSVPIHGILKEGPHARIPEKEALLAFRESIDGAILVGHHVGFDREMLQAACFRWGLPRITNPFLDTELLYRQTRIKSPLLKRRDRYTLDDLAAEFNLSAKDRHTALGDAHITALAFLHLIPMLRVKGIRTLPQLLKAGRI